MDDYTQDILPLGDLGEDPPRVPQSDQGRPGTDDAPIDDVTDMDDSSRESQVARVLPAEDPSSAAPAEDAVPPAPAEEAPPAAPADEPAADDVPAEDADSIVEPAEPVAATLSLGAMPDPGQGAVDAFFGPQKVDRPRLERPPLVPRWAIISAAVAVAVIVLGVVIGVWSTSFSSVKVPQVTGLDVGIARQRLIAAGLKVGATQSRFSTQRADTVLDQNPAPGSALKRGSTVDMVLSAGSEQFSMPDVVGNGLLLARGTLETRGLDVRIESVPSQQPSDTVIASNPPPGTSVHTGDTVLLTVAAPGPAASILLPYDLSGVTVVIDPATVNDGMTDVPLDVARRLRSLIEASQGTVVTTRALADTSTLAAAPARARKAGEASATVAVGLAALPSGAGGVTVYAPSPVLPLATASNKLASRIASALASESGSVQSSTASTDSVLGAAHAPWTRVQLGVFSSKEDVARFNDPAWEDSVARGLYKAIASLYGRKTSAAP